MAGAPDRPGVPRVRHRDASVFGQSGGGHAEFSLSDETLMVCPPPREGTPRRGRGNIPCRAPLASGVAATRSTPLPGALRPPSGGGQSACLSEFSKGVAGAGGGKCARRRCHYTRPRTGFSKLKASGADRYAKTAARRSVLAALLREVARLRGAVARFRGGGTGTARGSAEATAAR